MTEYFAFLRPAPLKEEIQDKELVDRRYTYWRWRIWYSMFFGYALYYFTRKSFVFAAPGIIEELGLTKADLGILGTVLSLSYGMSKFASGILSDRANPRYFMAIGLMLTGVCNIFFGMSSSLWFFCLFWGLNGWFQGFGWPPCARFLTHWYSHSERGSWWSSWNVSHNVGAFIIPLIVGAAMEQFGWRYALFAPGVICIIGGFVLIDRLRDTPQSMGLPPVEKWRNDYGSKKQQEVDGKELTTKELLFKYVLNNPFIWMLAIAYFFLYVVRVGVNDWSMLYLREAKSYSKMAAAGCISLFEVGGFAGSLVAGWGSDWICGARRGPINFLFALGIVASLLFFWAIPANHQMLDSIALFWLGFFIFGPQMLIGVQVVELAHKKATCTTSGFAGWCAYMGSAVAGYPLGLATEAYGWTGFFWFLLICSFVTLAFLFPLWSVVPEGEVHTKLAKA
ncbi:MAG: MFS transporter [Chlamydiia bacterium]|nr:MFS transporter [Chlamydiia bacterium]